MHNKVVAKGDGQPKGDKAPAHVGRQPGTKLVSCTVTDAQLRHITAQLTGYSLSNWLRGIVFEATAMPQELRRDGKEGEIG